MSSLTFGQRARLLYLTLFAKAMRAVFTPIARLRTPKATPDLVAYIPARIRKTEAKAKAKSSKEAARTIKTHIYLPPSDVQLPNLSPSPVFITACGSGFICDGLGLDSPYCRFIANETGHTVLDVGYSVAPENPFPDAPEDLVSVVKWVLSQPDRFDTSRISLCGFSAGGNIAASVAANYFPPETFWSLVLFYPVLDAVTDPKDKHAFSTGEPPLGGMGSISPSKMQFMGNCYFGKAMLRGIIRDSNKRTSKGSNEDDGMAVLRDPRASPGFAASRRFPRRCLFVCCEYDILARETEDLAKRISRGSGMGERGRRMILHRVKGCGHMFDKNVESGTEREKLRDEAYGMVVDLLNGE